MLAPPLIRRSGSSKASSGPYVSGSLIVVRASLAQFFDRRHAHDLEPRRDHRPDRADERHPGLGQLRIAARHEPQPRLLAGLAPHGVERRSEEHTSELQSLMRISYAVFCLKKQKKKNSTQPTS